MRLPDTRLGVTHKAAIFTRGEQKDAQAERRKFFFTVNMDAYGQPRELFVSIDASGSTLDGAMDCWAIAVSEALKRGATWEWVEKKYTGVRFEPCGWTEEKGPLRQVSSVVDYVVRWVGIWLRGEGDVSRGGVEGAENVCEQKQTKDAKEMDHAEADRG